MWSRCFKIWPGERIIGLIDKACQFWSLGKKNHHIKLYDRGEDYELFVGTPPHLKFTQSEKDNCNQLLKQFGVPENKSWVCIHNRDNEYLENFFSKKFTYHDYRDFSISTMVAAAEEITKNGHYVFRMGSVVKESLNSNNLAIIDYAKSELRTQLMDIFLLAHCRYFLGNDSGLWCVPLIFRRPIAMTNFTVLNNFYDKTYHPCIVILKHFRHKKLSRNLSLAEIFQMGLGNASKTCAYEKAEVELVPNSDQEIIDLMAEMELRVSGLWCETSEDKVLHSMFRDILRRHGPNDFNRQISMSLGTSFLRKNKYLLS